MKYLVAMMMLTTAFITPVKADEEYDEAVKMVSIILTYVSVCKLDDDMKSKMAESAATYMLAAGVTFDNPKFLARVTIRSGAFAHSARQDRNYCKLMTESYEKGRRGE